MSITTRRTLLLSYLGCVTLLCSATLQSQPIPEIPGRPTVVFRVDTTPPDVMFSEGIVRPDGRVFDLLGHARGASCETDAASSRTAWISTTSDRNQAERFLLRQFERAASAGDPPPQAWLYTVRTDHSYLNLVSILHQVILAGTNHQQGYSPEHAHILRNLLATSTITSRAEVVTDRINPRRIMSAQRVTYTANAPAAQQLVWHEGISNAHFAPPPALQEMNNAVEHLQSYVNRDGVDFYGYSFRVINTCFQTCDRSTQRHREKRSLTSATLNYCQAEPSNAEALIGSED